MPLVISHNWLAISSEMVLQNCIGLDLLECKFADRGN